MRDWKLSHVYSSQLIPLVLKISHLGALKARSHRFAD